MTTEERNKIFLENEKIIYSIIEKYRGFTDYEDLLQEARLFLLEAISNFDSSLGFQLSTYCYKYVKGKITTYITRKSKHIKYPSTINQNYFIVNKFCKENQISLQECDSYDVEFISKNTNLERSKILEVIDFAKDDFMASLEAPVRKENVNNGKDGICIKDIIVDESAYIEDNLYKYQKIDAEDFMNDCYLVIDDYLKINRLNEKTAEIMKDIILCLSKGERISGLSDKYNCSRQRIGQIKVRLFKILKVRLKYKYPDIKNIEIKG